MDLLDWFKSEAVRLWAAILIGIGIGLAGAYGKERHEGRTPDRHWLFNRLLIYPFLGLAAAFVSESFSLSPTKASFVASLFSLLAFDAVRILAARFVKRTEDAIDAVIKAADAGLPVQIPAGTDIPRRVSLDIPPPTAESVVTRNELRKAFPAPGKHERSLDELIEKLGSVPPTRWDDPNV